jgi:hypothetical protein
MRPAARGLCAFADTCQPVLSAAKVLLNHRIQTIPYLHYPLCYSSFVPRAHLQLELLIMLIHQRNLIK